jgi:hypothetical protein
MPFIVEGVCPSYPEEVVSAAILWAAGASSNPLIELIMERIMTVESATTIIKTIKRDMIPICVRPFAILFYIFGIY